METPKLKKRTGLGRGLSAILSDIDSGKSSASKEILNTVAEIPLSNIDVNPFQPRTNFDQEALEELAESIKLQGIIQPITVRKLDGDQFQLISGERRYRASKLAGLDKIPAYIRLANDQQMLEMAIIENVQRENLNVIEVALGYQRLISECDLKQEELGERVGKKRSTITNYLRLLKLPPSIQASLRDDLISMGHAKCLVNLESIELQLTLYKKILKEGLSVRKTEAMVKQLSQEREKKRANETETPESPEIQHVQNKLSSYFGTKVKIANSGRNKGEIKISYHSIEDLNRILDLINE